MEQLEAIIQIKNEKLRKKKKFKENYINLLYMIPVLSGIFIFTILPMAVSLVFSLCQYNLLSPEFELSSPNFDMFVDAFKNKEMWYAYYITFRATIVIGGISLVGSYIIALILNQKLKGIKTFRILFYLPCLIPGLVSSLLWNGITGPTGIFNRILIELGKDPFTFYTDNDTVFITQILLSGWGFSGNMIMWLAQFKNIPNDLYEEAKLSGAGYFSQLKHITIPLSTSMIFYNLIMSIIGNLQAFTSYATYIQYGSDKKDLYTVGLLIYERAFVRYDISYASALSWILFLVIGVLTAIVLKTSNQWVYYAEDN